MSINVDLFPRIEPLREQGNRPFWTVAIPAYNRPAMLEVCLRSVLSQDRGPGRMQILVVDDCSPTPLESTVRTIAGTRVEYFRNSVSRKLDNFNACLERSRGRWIHILHDDDWVLPGFYETLERALENQPASVGAACCRYANTDMNGNKVYESPLVRGAPGIIENWLDTVGIGNPLNPPAVVIRRNVYEHLGGYHPPLFYTGDWEMYRRVASFYDWWYEPKLLACYREHANNNTSPAMISGAFIADMRHSIAIADTYLPMPHRAQLTAGAQRNTALFAIDRSIPFLRASRPEAVRALITEALKTYRNEEVDQFIRQIAARPDAAPFKDMILGLLE